MTTGAGASAINLLSALSIVALGKEIGWLGTEATAANSLIVS